MIVVLGVLALVLVFFWVRRLVKTGKFMLYSHVEDKDAGVSIKTWLSFHSTVTIERGDETWTDQEVDRE